MHSQKFADKWALMTSGAICSTGRYADAFAEAAMKATQLLSDRMGLIRSAFFGHPAGRICRNV